MNAACFTAVAVRLAGLAGLRLGWSPDAFWRATPADLAAVVAALRPAAGEATPPDPATIARLKEVHPDG
ncbi:phage tail assembly chaperone [Sphingomonas bacterium]|uniref:phage tail assembly chaperone n=1 Tax=Sphingomonas bacterium TaxID=1895847 RepID=UPI001576E9E8|nr:phage tail assembly chaperone [Sphingomonas bacterium]